MMKNRAPMASGSASDRRHRSTSNKWNRYLRGDSASFGDCSNGGVSHVWSGGMALEQPLSVPGCRGSRLCRLIPYKDRPRGGGDASKSTSVASDWHARTHTICTQQGTSMAGAFIGDARAAAP